MGDQRPLDADDQAQQPGPAGPQRGASGQQPDTGAEEAEPWQELVVGTPASHPDRLAGRAHDERGQDQGRPAFGRPGPTGSQPGEAAAGSEQRLMQRCAHWILEIASFSGRARAIARSSPRRTT